MQTAVPAPSDRRCDGSRSVGRALIAYCCFALVLAASNARGADTPPAPAAGLIPAAEAMDLPTAARLDALATTPWDQVSVAAREATFTAFAQNRLNAAAAWRSVQDWARLFGESEQQFVPRWIKAVQEAGVGHANMPTSYSATPAALGERLSPGLRRWLLGQVGFSQEFFATVSSVDSIPQVFGILEELHRAQPERFREYASLALAIAVVYDVPPPPGWPHGQVSRELLPRRWPNPAQAFAWWVREDRAGRTYHRLARLRADELKFVVDAAAPAAEREWAQRNVMFPLPEFARVYPMVRYRLDRAQAFAYAWPGPTYQLAEILRTGGICVDQAYFATEAGKARGVPTLLFRGEGLDGRHAWFGYLDEHQQWQLNAGRYAEQRFLTGVAFDPQTWRDLSDHELKFLSDRFRDLPSFHLSSVHAAVADEMLRLGRAGEAAVTARKAVGYEPRHLPAWETLVAAQQAMRAGPVAIEATLREAARNLQKFPDLELRFADRVIASLRARGENSLAAQEERQLAQKFQAERSDLNIQQAAAALQRSFAGQPVPEQVRTYQAVLEQHGRGAGIEFFDKVVVVFAEHLYQLRENAEALRAVDRARQVLKVDQGKQLDAELTRLSERLRK